MMEQEKMLMLAIVMTGMVVLCAIIMFISIVCGGDNFPVVFAILSIITILMGLFVLGGILWLGIIWACILIVLLGYSIIKSLSK